MVMIVSIVRLYHLESQCMQRVGLRYHTPMDCYIESKVENLGGL